MARPEAASTDCENHATSASALTLGALPGNPSNVAGGFLAPAPNDTFTCHEVLSTLNSPLIKPSPSPFELILLRRKEKPKGMSTKSGSASQTRAKNAKRTSKRSTTGRSRIPEAASRASYPLAIMNDTWASSSRIKVEDVSGTNVIAIPFEFLSASQECSWTYIHYLISESVEEPGDLWHSESNALVDIAAEIAPGRYTYQTG